QLTVAWRRLVDPPRFLERVDGLRFDDSPVVPRSHDADLAPRHLRDQRPVVRIGHQEDDILTMRVAAFCDGLWIRHAGAQRGHDLLIRTTRGGHFEQVHPGRRAGGVEAYKNSSTK